MAQKKRDFLDEIIDIQQDWNALSNKGNELVDQLTADPTDAAYYDPDAYRERPRPSSSLCVAAASRNPLACTRCMDVCPVDAITINGSSLRVEDTCIRCGLCAAECPTEAFQVRMNAPFTMYDKIARAATAYEQCYLTCARALEEEPKPNVVVLPCVGALAHEVWFDLLCEFDNLSVYLPLGLCDDCSVKTGEDAFGAAIAMAEEWSGESVGYEIEEAALVHEQKRAYKRSQFVSNITTAGTRLVSRGNPALAGAQAVANRLRDHSKQITELQKTLESAVGAQSTQAKRRILTRKRRLLMAGLQKYPDLADEMFLEFPHIDPALCTMCGDCVKACSVHALEMDRSGRVLAEPAYCVNCGACKVVCEDGAIAMEKRDASELVMPDKQAEERARQRARVAKLKSEGKKKLDKGLDFLEGLADEDK